MASQNDLVQGINLSGLSQCSGADIEQAVREATPAANIAWIIVDASDPDVASNARFARYLRQEAVGSWFEYWDGATWQNLPLPSELVGNDSIADNSIEIGKLSASGGTADQMIRVNAAADGLEFFTFSLSTQSTDVNSLIKGTANQILVTNTAATATEWSTLSTLLNNLGQVVNPSNLKQGVANTNEVLTWDGAEWSPITVAAGLADGSVSLAKIAATGTAGQVIKIKGGGSGVEVGNVTVANATPGTANQVLQTSSDGTVAAWRTLFTTSPAQTFATEVSWTHGLTYTPTLVFAVIKPNASFANYASGDVIASYGIGAGGTGGFEPAVVPVWNGTTMKLLFKDNNGAGNEPTIIDKTTKAVTEITAGDYSKLDVYFIYSNF